MYSNIADCWNPDDCCKCKQVWPFSFIRVNLEIVSGIPSHFLLPSGKMIYTREFMTFAKWCLCSHAPSPPHVHSLPDTPPHTPFHM